MKQIASQKIKEINAVKESVDVVTEIREVATRRIWLAAPLYELVPVFYVVAGILCLFGAVYVSSSYWAVPYAGLCGLLCVHAGILIVRARLRFRRGRKDPGGTRSRD